MRRCNGRLFDGSACNNLLVDCAECGRSGCHGDGCDSQRFVAASCDCGSTVPVMAAAG
ncbi:MAG TPA: hypothetical protein VHV79_06185 [Mycobacteriales bacterium]|jgi:hypothetical protein|nr:hypothetical protein [Mycobacteriales bacterium]